MCVYIFFKIYIATLDNAIVILIYKETEFFSLSAIFCKIFEYITYFELYSVEAPIAIFVDSLLRK